MLLKEKRMSVNLTQEAVASYLNISRTTIAMWESGASAPRADKLPLLARLYGCTIDELFENPEERKAV